MVQLGPLIEREAVRIFDIGREAGLGVVVGEDDRQLPRDLGGPGLDGLQPGEQLARVELDRRQSGIIEGRRRLLIDPAATDQVIDEALDAPPFLAPSGAAGSELAASNRSRSPVS